MSFLLFFLIFIAMHLIFIIMQILGHGMNGGYGVRGNEASGAGRERAMTAQKPAGCELAYGGLSRCFV